MQGVTCGWQAVGRRQPAASDWREVSRQMNSNSGIGAPHFDRQHETTRDYPDATRGRGGQRATTGGNGRQRGATGDNGRQWETAGGNGRQRETTGDNGRQRDTTGDNGRHPETTGDNEQRVKKQHTQDASRREATGDNRRQRANCEEFAK